MFQICANLYQLDKCASTKTLHHPRLPMKLPILPILNAYNAEYLHSNSLYQCKMWLIIRLYKTGRRRKIDGMRSSGDFRIRTSVKSWTRTPGFSFIDDLRMVQWRRAAALHGRSTRRRMVDTYDTRDGRVFRAAVSFFPLEEPAIGSALQRKISDTSS